MSTTFKIIGKRYCLNMTHEFILIDNVKNPDFSKLHMFTQPREQKTFAHFRPIASSIICLLYSSFYSGLFPCIQLFSVSCGIKETPLKPKIVPITSKVSPYFTVIRCFVQEQRSYAVSSSYLHLFCWKNNPPLQMRGIPCV